jgi:hypothetical protein
LKLNPVARDTFENATLGTVVFQRDAEGRIPGFSLYSVNVRGVAFQRVH